MNLIKYLLFKSYRENLNKKYTAEICNSFLYEELKHEEIYSILLGSLKTAR